MISYNNKQLLMMYIGSYVFIIFIFITYKQKHAPFGRGHTCPSKAGDSSAAPLGRALPVLVRGFNSNYGRGFAAP